MNIETLGSTIRTFLRDLFGSRLSAHLEESLARLRSDYETRLLERERTIADLREQLSLALSKVDRYELVLLPLSSPLGSMFAPRRDHPPTFEASTDKSAPKSWDELRAENDAEQARLAVEERAHNGTDQGRQA